MEKSALNGPIFAPSHAWHWTFCHVEQAVDNLAEVVCDNSSNLPVKPLFCQVFAASCFIG
jgi:hypothetical protein